MGLFNNELIISFIGTIIIVLASISSKRYLRYFNQEKWWHRYSLRYWTPIYIHTKTRKIMFYKKLKGFRNFWSPITSQTFWTIIGLTLVVVGFVLKISV